MRPVWRTAGGLRAAGATARRLLRGLAIVALSAVLVAICISNTARALDIYTDHFMRLSARPLGMGGTGAALAQPAAVFYNPAALASLRRFTLMYNHSGRHFPGSHEGRGTEYDQLDGDTEAFVVPLPLATYAHGFTFSGELGYDYSFHPADGSLGYPREHYWGSEDYDALAFSLGLPCAVGASLRRSLGRLTPAPEDPDSPAWLRYGEGVQWGWLARVWPGLDYGHSELKLDYDWTVLDRPAPAGAAAPAETAVADSQAPGLPCFSSRQYTKRSGWALHPTGWLTLARDSVDEQYLFDWKKGGAGFAEPVGLGLIHVGNMDKTSIHSGGELSLGALAKLRWGIYDGMPTWGAALNLGGLWLNYSEIKDLLPKIVGAGQGCEDVHIYGAEVEF